MVAKCVPRGKSSCKNSRSFFCDLIFVGIFAAASWRGPSVPLCAFEPISVKNSLLFHIGGSNDLEEGLEIVPKRVPTLTAKRNAKITPPTMPDKTSKRHPKCVVKNCVDFFKMCCEKLCGFFHGAPWISVWFFPLLPCR